MLVFFGGFAALGLFDAACELIAHYLPRAAK